MSQDLPDLPEILRVVREFIDKIKDNVPDQERYHAMCCSYLLAVAEREVINGATLDAEESNALSAFLGKPLNAAEACVELAIGLRAGRFDSAWEQASDLVMRHVIDKVIVSKPEHLHAMHRAMHPGENL